jgi:DNA-binding transcriptional regulator LsrR (DeoR family)
MCFIRASSHLARLTSRQVLSIRRLYPKGHITQAELAQRFGVSTAHVMNILARRSWKHI